MDLEFKDIDLYFRVTMFDMIYERCFDFDFEDYEDAHNFALLLRKSNPDGTIRMSVQSNDFEY